jgi:hypothetical protein
MADDVTTTLGELERKLKELERELEVVGRGGEADTDPAVAGDPLPRVTLPPPPGATPFPPPGFPPAAGVPVPAPAAFRGAPGDAPFVAEWRGGDVPPAPPRDVVVRPADDTPPAAASGAGLRAHLDELQRVRAQLLDVADRLVAELSAAVDELESGAAEPLLDGRVVVEAGRFADVMTLGAFEQALQRTPGVGRVYVRSLEDGRAQIEVDLERPIALAAELARTATVAFRVSAMDEGRLVLVLEP